MLLEVNKIDAFYGLSHILFGVSLEIDEGEIVGILGRNGVGKTTTLRSIMGLTPPQSGSIMFDGEEIKGKQHFQIARRGIGFVPEDRIIFPDLTVLDNLMFGARKGKYGEQWTLERIYSMFPILKERERQDGGTLSGGEQQMLTVARTLMGNPRLLLLDDPVEGLAPALVRAMEEQMLLLKHSNVTTLIAEENSHFIQSVCDRIYILEKGEVCWHGDALELKENPEILKKYLGL
ncbi:MAG: ABC transporter ATP-binding protein [Desulfobacteraceae bacterium]|jgi:branched-chain amino acid transport system ATP-binding protein|nr:ABC transporter ATP-binding protein [Desulfobacteraceae bacterium]